MKAIKAKELRAILATVADDDSVYVGNEKGEGYAIRSYTLYRYEDGHVELTLFKDDMCGLDI